MKLILENAQLPELQVVIRGDVFGEQAQKVVQALNSSESTGKMFLYKNEKEFVVKPQEIFYFQAYDGKVLASTANGSYETKFKLYEIIENMYSQGFAQINKSTIVNIDAVFSVEPEFSGNYTVNLKNSKEKLTVSRKFAKAFRNHILEVK